MASDPGDPVADLLPLPPADFLVLAVLVDGEEYAYRIAEQIRRRSGERLSVRPGNLYRVIDRLMDRGLVEPGPRQATSEGPERQYYRITPFGARVIRAEAEAVTGMLKASPQLARATGLGGPS